VVVCVAICLSLISVLSVTRLDTRDAIVWHFLIQCRIIQQKTVPGHGPIQGLLYSMFFNSASKYCTSWMTPNDRVCP